MRRATCVPLGNAIVDTIAVVHTGSVGNARLIAVPIGRAAPKSLIATGLTTGARIVHLLVHGASIRRIYIAGGRGAGPPRQTVRILCTVSRVEAHPTHTTHLGTAAVPVLQTLAVIDTGLGHRTKLPRRAVRCIQTAPIGYAFQQNAAELGIQAVHVACARKVADTHHVLTPVERTAVFVHETCGRTNALFRHTAFFTGNTIRVGSAGAIIDTPTSGTAKLVSLNTYALGLGWAAGQGLTRSVDTSLTQGSTESCGHRLGAGCKLAKPTIAKLPRRASTRSICRRAKLIGDFARWAAHTRCTHITPWAASVGNGCTAGIGRVAGHALPPDTHFRARTQTVDIKRRAALFVFNGDARTPSAGLIGVTVTKIVAGSDIGAHTLTAVETGGTHPIRYPYGTRRLYVDAFTIGASLPRGTLVIRVAGIGGDGRL